MSRTSYECILCYEESVKLLLPFDESHGDAVVVCIHDAFGRTGGSGRVRQNGDVLLWFDWRLNETFEEDGDLKGNLGKWWTLPCERVDVAHEAHCMLRCWKSTRTTDDNYVLNTATQQLALFPLSYRYNRLW